MKQKKQKKEEEEEKQNKTKPKSTDKQKTKTKINRIIKKKIQKLSEIQNKTRIIQSSIYFHF